jgi:hypothetical protein
MLDQLQKEISRLRQENESLKGQNYSAHRLSSKYINAEESLQSLEDNERLCGNRYLMERHFGKIMFELIVKKGQVLENGELMRKFRIGLNQHVHNHLFKTTCKSAMKIRGAQRKFEQMGP